MKVYYDPEPAYLGSCPPLWMAQGLGDLLHSRVSLTLPGTTDIAEGPYLRGIRPTDLEDLARSPNHTASEGSDETHLRRGGHRS